MIEDYMRYIIQKQVRHEIGRWEDVGGATHADDAIQECRFQNKSWTPGHAKHRVIEKKSEVTIYERGYID